MGSYFKLSFFNSANIFLSTLRRSLILKYQQIISRTSIKKNKVITMYCANTGMLLMKSI